jgi:undecaprenyl-diphosphatase
MLLARGISRLGDGELWVAPIVALALMPGDRGVRCALHSATKGIRR